MTQERTHHFTSGVFEKYVAFKKVFVKKKKKRMCDMRACGQHDTCATHVPHKTHILNQT